MCESKKKEIDKKKPGEDGSTVTLILSGSTSLGMSLPIRLHGIFLRAFVAFPLLLTVLPAEMLLYSGQVSQSPAWVVVDACRLGAYVDSLPYLIARPLPKLPGKIVASSV